MTRQKRQPLEKLVAAREVDAAPEEQEEVIRNMHEMLEALGGKAGFAANVLECIIDHRSFSQTIENLFALSFLVGPAARTALQSFAASRAAPSEHAVPALSTARGTPPTDFARAPPYLTHLHISMGICAMESTVHIGAARSGVRIYK